MCMRFRAIALLVLFAAASACAPKKTVRGVCVDPLGRPVAGVRVTATRDREEVVAMSGASGAFRLDLPVQWGKVEVVVRAARHIEESFGRRLADPVTDVGKIVLRPAAVLRGQLVDGADQPVGGATVRVFADRGYLLEETVTDGWFATTKPLSPGWWFVEYGHQRAATLLGAGENPPLKLTVLPAVDTIEGEVVDDDGVPVVGVNVSARMGLLGVCEAASDHAGRFVLARSLSRIPVPAELWAGTGQHTTTHLVGVAWGTRDLRLTLRKHRPGTLRVRDAQTKEVLAGIEVVVRVVDEVLPQYGTADADGLVELEDLPPGLLSVSLDSVTGNAVLPANATLDVPTQLDGPLDLLVGQGQSRQVRVLRADGNPVPGVRLEVWRADADAASCVAQTDLHGEASVFGVPGDEYEVHVRAVDSAGPWPFSLTQYQTLHTQKGLIFAEQAEPLVLTIGVGGTVQGRLVPAGALARLREHARIAGWSDEPRVWLRNGTDTPRRIGIDADGKFELGGLPPGDLELAMTLSGTAHEDAAVARIAALQVSETRAVEVSIEAFVPVELRGRVTIDGEPYSGSMSVVGEVAGVGAEPGVYEQRCVALDGVFHCAVMPGSWRARVMVAEPGGAGSQLESGPVTVGPGKPAEATFAIDVVAVELRVRNARGEAVQSVFDVQRAPSRGAFRASNLHDRRDLALGEHLLLLTPGSYSLRPLHKRALDLPALRAQSVDQIRRDLSEMPLVPLEVPAGRARVALDVTLPDVAGY